MALSKLYSLVNSNSLDNPICNLGIVISDFSGIS